MSGVPSIGGGILLVLAWAAACGSSGSGGGSSTTNAPPTSASQSCSTPAFAPPARSAPLAPAALKLDSVNTTLSFPLFMTAPRCDTTRLFVVEKGGAIRIIKNGVLLSRPFLNLAGQVSTGGEQGLLGLAFDPNFSSNRRFYVNYTDLVGTTVLARYLADPVDPDVAVPTVDRAMLRIVQPFENHNGGMLTFGPDGYLYIGMGDGGSGGDPDNRAQNLSDLLGKLLRIDVATSMPPNEYTLPADNPFIGRPGASPEIWSLGLRNPWRFAFDRLTGDLYLADVGQSEREEIDVSPGGSSRGANYGWRLMEGFLCFNPSSNCNSGTALIAPVLDYGHTEGCAVTGGYVYRGAAIPALRGTYFYADFCQGWVRSFRYQNGQPTELTDWPLLRPSGNITSFGEDAGGEVYVMTSQGGLFRIVAN